MKKGKKKGKGNLDTVATVLSIICQLAGLLITIIDKLID